MSERYLSLLRGINVGGKNVIGKDDLRRCFEDLGFERVRTYIQSGNVLFRTAAADVAKLNTRVEQGLSDRFSYAARSVVLSRAGYTAALAAAPPAKPDIDAIAAGPGIVFWSAPKDRITRSAFMKLPSLPVYQQVTIRNHNTVRKLAALLDER